MGFHLINHIPFPLITPIGQAWVYGRMLIGFLSGGYEDRLWLQADIVGGPLNVRL